LLSVPVNVSFSTVMVSAPSYEPVDSAAHPAAPHSSSAAVASS
jgi:hypothetical protein